MIKTSDTGAKTVVLNFTDLNHQIELLSLYESKTIKDKEGAGAYEDIPITKDEYEIIIPFYKECHSLLFPVLSTILNQDTPQSFTDGTTVDNILWNLTEGTYQANILPIIDNHLERAYIHYALFKWFATQNLFPDLANKYRAMFDKNVTDITSSRLHKNDKATRPFIPYRTF